MNSANTTDTHWGDLEPLLDEAVASLDESTRTAVLLRFFQNKYPIGNPPALLGRLSEFDL
jgi:hypothetical protein